jgi:uncharacterized repeat protein (TIGR02543 family)
MKKLVSVLMVVLAVWLFFSCDTGDNTDGDKTIVTLDPTTLTVEVGEGRQITATTKPANTILTWTSDTPTVATVNPGGYVIGVSVGTATITAKAADGGKATCAVTVTPAVSSDVIVEGNTLVHSPAKLATANRWGGTKGTENPDGSYTFDSTSDQYNGDGMQYNFPVPKANDTWKLEDYDLFKMYLKVTDGSVQAIIKQGSANVDLIPYPSGSQYLTFNSTSNGGEYTFEFVIAEAGTGIGFQRNNGGPATVAIEKVVFSKGTMYTITFSGGEYTAMPAIPSIKIPEGRTVGGTSYPMPQRPTRPNYTFVKWVNTDGSDFDQSTPITSNVTLKAIWEEGAPEAVDMKLDLNPANWDTLPSMPSNWTVGSITWPTNYAVTAYDSSTGKLTLTFDGNNRQRAIIPLSQKQIDELLNTEEGGVTFRIVGTVARGEQGTLTNTQIAAGDLGFAGFRLHLIDPTVSDTWNGTTTGKQTPLTGNTDESDDHLVEYRTFDSKTAAKLGYFAIQAMFIDSSNSNGSTATGFPKVIITIDSITVDIGDTTN